MNNNVFEQMLSAYPLSNPTQRSNAEYEVSQKIILAGLYRAGFFNKAAFYGGTCLRIFHNLNRFSEDLDFSLLKADTDFNIENYFPSIIEEFKLLGREIVITKKDKRMFGRVESAFLKDTTEVYNIAFQTKKTIKVKIEVDTQPPLKFDTEPKLLLQPYSFVTRCFTLPNLYAGKMHALVYRAWKTRVKGRDWFDFEWYVRNNVPLDFSHLQERIREFSGNTVTQEQFMDLLKEKLATTDIELVKKDVVPYISDLHVLDIWSNDYFLLLADRIRFV